MTKIAENPGFRIRTSIVKKKGKSEIKTLRLNSKIAVTKLIPKSKKVKKTKKKSKEGHNRME